jgi:hypothetical protein
VCAGALERGGPRREGVEPSSEAFLARGGVEPSSEADLTRWGVEASSGAGFARGCVYPSSGVDLTRGGIRRATLVGCGGHPGRERVMCFRFVG